MTSWLVGHNTSNINNNSINYNNNTTNSNNNNNNNRDPLRVLLPQELLVISDR
jgi:hypothetical protein